MSAIVTIYVSLIIAGRKEYSQVPASLKTDVKSELAAIGLDENGQPI